MYIDAKQAAPGATTEVDIYTVPNNKAFVNSSIIICNRGAATSYRIVVAPTGAVTSNEMYIAYDRAIQANDSHEFTLGLTIIETSVVRVYSTSGNVSFTLSGKEVEQ